MYINIRQTINRLRPLTYTDFLLLLVILDQTCRISMQTGMNVQNSTKAMLCLPTD